MNRYIVEFSQSSGQYAGRHEFFVKKAMNDFIAKALRLGYTEYRIL